MEAGSIVTRDTVHAFRPGNPLRVACRTCGAQPGATCVYPRGQERVHGEFHGKRSRDAFRDYVASPRVSKSKRDRPSHAPRRPHRSSTPIAVLGELPAVERAVSEVSRDAKDIQTPAFWQSVWNEP